MAKQLHKKFSDNQIKELIGRYSENKIKRIDIQKILGIGKTRFFALVKEYKKDPFTFSVDYFRKNATHKIPYRWIQDRLVRTCAREEISNIKDAQKILGKEIHRYNYKQVHSTTGEVPYL